MERQLTRRGFFEICGQMVVMALLPSPAKPLRPSISRYQTIHPDLVAGIEAKPADSQIALLPIINDIKLNGKMSDFGREKLGNVLVAANELSKNGHIRWYLINQYQVPSMVSDSNPSSSSCLPSPNTNVLLMDFRDVGSSIVVNQSSHELYHAYRSYTRFKGGQTCRIRSLADLDDEERNAQFMGWLTETSGSKIMGMTEGYKEDRFFNSSGTNDGQIVWFLDQNNYKPDSEIYRLIFDMQLRFGNPYLAKEFEDKWRDKPLSQEEMEIVKYFKAKSWVQPNFFLN